MSGARTAAKVLRGMQKAGIKVGSGPLVCTIKRSLHDEPADRAQPETPWQTPADPLALATFYPVTAIETLRGIRDATNSNIEVARRTLLVDATGVVPVRTDTIAVGVAPDDIDDTTRFEEISSVSPIAPGGVALMYELEMKS